MKYGYSTFLGRPKETGRVGYGMTAKKALQLQQIGKDSAASCAARAENLYLFTEIYIKHARDLARSGQKDEARNYFRFFNNSQIVPLLELLKIPRDVVRLRDELSMLGLECHPLEPANFTTEIESIHGVLNEILTHVKAKSSAPENLPCSPFGGLGNRESCDIRRD